MTQPFKGNRWGHGNTKAFGVPINRGAECFFCVINVFAWISMLLMLDANLTIVEIGAEIKVAPETRRER